MKEINILTPEIYNRLSAGEVVENAASIVKELVENSIDANTHKIIIEITNGGIDEIVVTDDGDGVAESELKKIFLPHATSKIKTVHDIDNIGSLGFRGEAMASIASVSQVEFISKPAGQSYAVSVNQLNETKVIAGNQGTTVKVSNLFYNIPARKKFLRSSSIEKHNVTEVVENLIFTNPHLFIKYYVDGKLVLDHRGTGLAYAINQIFGIDMRDMLEVDYSNDGISVKGYISNIKVSKNNKQRQIVSINGRVINGGVPAFAVNEVMANYLPNGEFPIFVLALNIDPKNVDVNVHPQKKEVRFEDKNAIITFIKDAIVKAMDKYFMGEFTAIVKPVELPYIQTNIAGKSYQPYAKESENILIQSLNLFDNNETVFKSAPNILNSLELNSVDEPAEQTTAFKSSNFSVLGQVFETYLIICTEDSLIIIDQHAMAERINYDKLKRQVDAGTVNSQILLSPIIIKLSPRELSNYEKIKDLLSSFGFECEEFGADAIRISAIPVILSNAGVKEFLNIVLSDKDVVNNSLSDTVKDKVASIACKASIKAGDMMSQTQIEFFVNSYFQNGNIPLCPHGRPIMLVYSKTKLETLFARK